MGKTDYKLMYNKKYVNIVRTTTAYFKLFAKNCIVRRRKCCLYLLWAVLLLVTLWSISTMTSRALWPPPSMERHLQHFRRSRDVQYYLNNIKLLVEPSSVPCSKSKKTPVITLVASAPSHVARRRTIRETWGKHLPTYFLLGLDAQQPSKTLKNTCSVFQNYNYAEANQYDDMIIYDMVDHYQNLTLKSVLMLQWTLERCPRATYMFKTDDDVMVNPWTLKTVLEEHYGAPLLGHRLLNVPLVRDETSKWYVPRWLLVDNFVPEYLLGVGYFIRGDYLQKILTAAKEVPLINIEDIYLTYLVAIANLKIEVEHDYRLSKKIPWIPLDCAYESRAYFHKFAPTEMAYVWAKIEGIPRDNDSKACNIFKKYLDFEFLYYYLQ